MTLAFGELVTDAVIGFTGTGDLFNIGGAPLLSDDVDAVLKAGLAAVVPKIDVPVDGAGVLMTTDETLVLGSTGLRLQLLFKIGVSLLFVARIGDEDSFQTSVLCSEPFCNCMSSSELLFVTENRFFKMNFSMLKELKSFFFTFDLFLPFGRIDLLRNNRKI